MQILMHETSTGSLQPPIEPTENPFSITIFPIFPNWPPQAIAQTNHDVLQAPNC